MSPGHRRHQVHINSLGPVLALPSDLGYLNPKPILPYSPLIPRPTTPLTMVQIPPLQNPFILLTPPLFPLPPLIIIIRDDPDIPISPPLSNFQIPQPFPPYQNNI